MSGSALHCSLLHQVAIAATRAYSTSKHSILQHVRYAGRLMASSAPPGGITGPCCCCPDCIKLHAA